jgi:hypothetical protein
VCGSDYGGDAECRIWVGAGRVSQDIPSRVLAQAGDLILGVHTAATMRV